MARGLQKIDKYNFFKNILIIVGSTASAQIINALVSPILSRLYSPEEFGVLSVYSAMLGMFSIVASLKYEWAVPIAKDEDDAYAILILSYFILLIYSFLIIIILLIRGDSLLGLLSSEAISPYSYIIPLGIFLVGAYSATIQWSFRTRSFKDIARTRFTQTLTANVVKIVAGLMKAGPLGLIFGKILGDSAGIKLLTVPVLISRKGKPLFPPWGSIRAVARRYRNFPIFSAPSQLLNTAGLQMPVLFLSSLYGPAVAGLFGFTNSVINQPMDIISQSVGDVFYGEATSIGRSDPAKLLSLSKQLFRKLLLIGLIPIAILLAFGPPLFVIVFGAQWKDAGSYARILSIMVYSRFIFLPASRIYSVFEKQKESLLLDTFRVILVLISFGVTWIFRLKVEAAILQYSISMSIVYFATFLLAQKIMRNHLNDIN